MILYEYTNAPPKDAKDAQLTLIPYESGVLPWLWVHRTPEGVLEPTEVGNMSYFWLQTALVFLEAENAEDVGERSSWPTCRNYERYATTS